MSAINYTVTVTEEAGHPEPLKEYHYTNSTHAENMANVLSKEYSDKLVFVSFHRKNDGQHGYMNRNGEHSLTGTSWTDQ